MHSPIWNTRNYPNRLNFSFALVIEEAPEFRDLVMALLRERGWLVHGTSRAEQAFSILAHIPYDLIVLDSELPGICGIDFVRILQNSREWRTIQLVVIKSSDSPSFASQFAERGAFLARRSTWEDDLSGFLSAYGESSDSEPTTMTRSSVTQGIHVLH
jgi:CheY-like chemotaxis protein